MNLWCVAFCGYATGVRATDSTKSLTDNKVEAHLNSSPIKAALLVLVAVALGVLIFLNINRYQQSPVVDGVAVETELPAEETLEDVEAVPVVEPTPDVFAVEPRPNIQVVIQVANGTDVSGQGAKLTSILRNADFNTRQASNAPARVQSVIYYNPGYGPEAEQARITLNSDTPIAPMPEPPPSIDGVDMNKINVLVWIGSDDLSTRGS